ncbi:MAG: pilus assembly protein TadG-related protein [Pseudomonadota bacterium]
MKGLLPSCFVRRAARVAEDESGAILVLFAVSTGLIFGFLALVWDIGRTVSTATELQSFADHLALAAAGELDGEAGAIAEATAVVASGDFDDTVTFASGGPILDGGDVQLTFYASIPGDDTAPLTDITGSDRAALYVEVEVIPQTVTNLFASVVNALAGTEIANGVLTARAIAGRKRIACSITPLAYCTPDGPAYQPQAGRMIRLEMNALWQPGSFGLLANNFEPGSACGNIGTAGGAVVSCITGITENVTRCYDPTGVTIVNTVSAQQVAGGLNSRFDIYLSQLAGLQNDARFAPAPSVTKAITDAGGDACIDGLGAGDVTDLSELPDDERSVPLPRDGCFGESATCAATGLSLGTGVTEAELDDYWAINHGGVRPAASTRLELYEEEVAAAPVFDRVLQKDTSQETGAPTCHQGGAVPTTESAERRLLNAAVINCDPGSGLPIRGLVSDVPVLDFVQLFMTEPAELSPSGNRVAIWAEEVQSLTPLSEGLGNGDIRDVVQLVR